MKTVLFVGAGRHQHRAIRRAKELGLLVAAIDRNEGAPGFADADATEVVDFADTAVAIEAGRRLRPDGVLTIASDRAVPVVAAVAEALGLRGIGSETARLATNKIAMRTALAEAGVPQPPFAAVRTLGDARAAVDEIGLPAVLKPADSAGQRGLSVLRSAAELEPRLQDALAESLSGEAIVERFLDGVEINSLAVAIGGEVTVLTLSDRRRPGGAGFGVCLAHVFPATIDGDAAAEAERVAAASVRAIGLVDSVAYPQLLVSADGVRLVEIAARVPAGLMDEVSRIGIGVDLVQIALLQALGEPVPDELLRSSERRPLAIRFLTAEPGPLPVGVVRSVNGLERSLASPGVVGADSYIVPGETIRRPLRDGDRRGYVIAVGESGEDALARADAAAALVHVEVSDPRVEIVAAGYDRMADTFAEWRDRIEGDPRAEWRAELVSRLPDGARVLELGCGAGNSPETQELARRFRLTGVDVSAEQIRRARANVPGAELVHADFLELELPAESFDGECSFYVLNHVPRERLGPLLQRIAGWLRPGGLALNAFGATDVPGWTGEFLGAETFFAGYEPPENTRLVEAAGLTILRDEVVTFTEPEGPVRFHWILARK